MADTPQQAQRRHQAAAIDALEKELVSLHLDSFPDARPPKATPAKPVDLYALREQFGAKAGLPALEAELEPFGFPPKAPTADAVNHSEVIASHRKRTLREVPLMRLTERRQAKREALVAAQTAIAEEEAGQQSAAAREQLRLDASWAEVQRVRAAAEDQAQGEAKAETARRAEQERAEQADLDREWSLLVENDPETVERRLTVLSDWAQRRRCEVVGVTCDRGEALVVVSLDPPEASIPDQRADITAGGRPTVKKRSQTDRNHLYFAALSSVVLALARHAFATAPGLQRVGVLVARRETGAVGRLAPIYFGRFGRDDPRLVSERPADAAELAVDVRVNLGGRTDAVNPIDLSDEPALRAALGRASAG